MSVSLTRRFDLWNDFFCSLSNNLRCRRLSTKRPGLESNTGPVENVKMARDARGWRRIMIMTRMAARVTAANYQVSWGLRTMVRRIFETGNIIRHSRYVSCQSISWNRKKFHVVKKKCPRNIIGWHLDILAPKVLFTDNQNDNLFQMVEDFLVIVTKTDRSDNNLLFVVLSLEHVLNVTRERRAREGAIN